MRSQNEVKLTGMVSNAKVKHIPNGSTVAEFRLETLDEFPKDGKLQHKCQWHNVVCWNAVAEKIAADLQDGRIASVKGKLQTKSWVTHNGSKSYKTETLAFYAHIHAEGETLEPSGHPDAKQDGSPAKRNPEQDLGITDADIGF